MSDGMAFSQSESNGRRLNGWKEIAAYFERSVRTVQRWEAEHQLPVRRLGMGRAEVVSALVADLERWRETSEAEAARQAPDAPARANGTPTSDGESRLGCESTPGTESAAPARTSEAAPSAGSSHVSRIAVRWSASLIALLLLSAAIARGAWWKWGRSPATEAAEPHSVQVVDKKIVVLDAAGRALWTHQFDDALSSGTERQRVVDLNADGHNEVLAVSGVATVAPGSVTLHCFDYKGGLLWTHRQQTARTFGSEVYKPPFPVERLFVTDSPDGRKFVWVSSPHIPWFPTVLHKLDSAGAVRGEYWSNGWITWLETAQWDGRRVVLVGARNNEFESASLALLDESEPSGSAPAADPRYKCRDCPAGSPLAFVVFPKPARLAQLSGSAPVKSVQTDVNGSVVAWVDYAADFYGSALVFFTLDRQLRPVRVDAADTFETACLELARRGSIPRFAPREGLEQLRSVRWWNGSTITELKAQRGPERPGN
jgi:hypothetical protein